MRKWMFIYIFFGLYLAPNATFGFTLTVTPTNESCAGNGSLTFNPSNIITGGSITYLVYKLPDLTTPFAALSSNLLAGLSSGTYRIIATETDGVTTTVEQIDVIINNTIAPLQFNIQSVNQACSTTSNIIINTTSGIAVSYEIFDGPIRFPLQSSNTFSGLPVGVYKIRVFDNCGNGVVSTFTITLNPIGLTIGTPVYSNISPPSCTFTNVSNTITSASGTVIGYPLNIQYTINPPGGGTPIISNISITNGNLFTLNISKVIPLFNNQSFNYSITIFDACGSIYTSNFIVDLSISLNYSITPINCNQNFFTLNTTNSTPPYTLNFTNFPTGFNPFTANSNYPGPYNVSDIIFGNATNPSPVGTYEVSVTDACGRTKTIVFDILEIDPIPIGTVSNNGCLTNSGQMVVTIPNYIITTAIITNAPPSYPFPLPHNVTSSITANVKNNSFTLNPIPIGDYIINLTNECFDIIPPFNLTVPVYTNQGLAYEIRPGCSINKGSVSVFSLNGKLTSISITAAPPNFTIPLPYNGNLNIAQDGKFYMNDFPAGNYTFSCVDECFFTNSITVFIEGYTIISSSLSIQENCGSFNIPLYFDSNGTNGQTYWLQKQISPNIWGHPSTGVIYSEGSVPNQTNSYSIQNNTTNINLSFNGTFRIIRNFYTFNNGSEINSGNQTTINKSCIEILSPLLMFNQSLEIVTVNRMSCTSSGTLDVFITAKGTLPLLYKIIEKDGLPFLLDNGTSNLFVSLPYGIYIIQVEDNCGNIVNRQFDVIGLLSLVNITKPLDILQCKNTINGNETFNIATLNSVILGSQSAADYSISYYTSLSDAQQGSNQILNLINFNPVTNPQTIYARVIFNQIPSCYETTSFELIVGKIPSLIVNPNYLNCANSPVNIDASTNNLPTTSYLWSNGSTGSSITISQVGETNLTVTATNIYGTNGQSCTNTKDITVTISEIPEFERFETVDWTDNENSITVITSNTGSFEYSIDGINFQDSPTFTNLRAGVYTVYVRDMLGCGIINQEIWLLNYPKFFTPNGDGYNDIWYIKNSQFEPNLKVEIYDRYGKFIYNFNSSTSGWDGKFNNSEIFSTDYWFIVYRQDGRIHKGHFALKR